MADLALGGLERIIKACLAIKKAMETVHQNKKGCRDVERCVDIITGLLSRHKDLTMGAMMHHPPYTGPLDVLAESMEEALQLITDCQHKNALRHLLGAGDMAKKLRRVKEDIQCKMIMVDLATSILIFEMSVSVHYVGAHPPCLQPQVAGEVNSYDSNLSVIEMRPGVNNNTTMVATGNAEQYAYSSAGLMEFNSSKWESSLHLSSEEIIGGHVCAFKQKFVIKVLMTSDRSRAKALALVCKAAGVISVAITGDGKDLVEVVGGGVDTVLLICALRKKVGVADILMVEDATESRHRRNGKLPARQRSIPPSEASSSSSPAHHVAAQPWPYPNVAAIESQEDVGSSPRGRTAYLRDAAAYLREWVEPVVPMHGILFVLAFLLFLGFELLRGCFNPQ